MKIKKVNELNTNIKEDVIVNYHEEIQNLKKLFQMVYEDAGDNMFYDGENGCEFSMNFEEYWSQYGDRLILESGILDVEKDIQR